MAPTTSPTSAVHNQDDIPTALAEPLLESSNKESNGAGDSSNTANQETPSNSDITLPSSRNNPQLPPALAWARSTPCLIKLLLPLAIILTHYLFYYGQTANMWRLYGEWQADLSFHVTSTEARVALETLRLPTEGSWHNGDRNNATDIRTFTYSYAITELWKAKGMTGVFIPRLASVGLIVFSGIWPHVKLCMLLLTWWFGRQPLRRRRTLTSLSILGKWSLVDVLVVVSMVGVLNVSVDFTATNLMAGVQRNLPSLLALGHSLYDNTAVCTMALKYSCDHPKRIDKWTACNTCKTLVGDLVRHPDHTRKLLDGIHVEGGGGGRLYVAGLDGIYSFCAAVILSILLSFVVDWCDVQYRQSLEEDEEENSRERNHNNNNTEEESVSRAPEVSGTLGAAEDGLSDALLLQRASRDRRTEVDRAFDQQIFVERQQKWNLVWQVLSFVTLLVVLLGTLLVTTERKVHGALPSFLHELLGVEWTMEYNFWRLGWVTGKAGGRDYMLMGTFVWFVIAGPLLRSVLNIVASFRTETPGMNVLQVARVKRQRRNLSNWIDFVGAFCAWEVVTVSSMMVDLLMPSVTSTILNDARCGKLGQGTSQCFESEFNMTRMFAFVVVGWILLLVSSYGSRSYRFYES